MPFWNLHLMSQELNLCFRSYFYNRLSTYSEMWTKRSVEPSAGTTNPCPLSLQKSLMTPFRTGVWAAASVLYIIKKYWQYGWQKKKKTRNWIRFWISSKRTHSNSSANSPAMMEFLYIFTPVIVTVMWPSHMFSRTKLSFFYSHDLNRQTQHG